MDPTQWLPWRCWVCQAGEHDEDQVEVTIPQTSVQFTESQALFSEPRLSKLFNFVHPAVSGSMPPGSPRAQSPQRFGWQERASPILPSPLAVHGFAEGHALASARANAVPASSPLVDKDVPASSPVVDKGFELPPPPPMSWRSATATSPGDAMGNGSMSARTAAARAMERAKIRELMKHFATRAFSGVTCELVDEQGIPGPAMYRLDERLRCVTFSRLVSCISDDDGGGWCPLDDDVTIAEPVAAVAIGDIAEVLYPRGEAEGHADVIAGLTEEQTKRLLILLNSDRKQRLCFLETTAAYAQSFFTCVRILKRYLEEQGLGAGTVKSEWNCASGEDHSRVDDSGRGDAGAGGTPDAVVSAHDQASRPAATAAVPAAASEPALAEPAVAEPALAEPDAAAGPCGGTGKHTTALALTLVGNAGAAMDGGAETSRSNGRCASGRSSARNGASLGRIAGLGHGRPLAHGMASGHDLDTVEALGSLLAVQSCSRPMAASLLGDAGDVPPPRVGCDRRLEDLPAPAG